MPSWREWRRGRARVGAATWRSWRDGRARVGSIFDDIGDVATSAWDDLKNTVPGLGPIADALDSFASGPLRDFARTPWGKAVLTIASSNLYLAAAPAAGAQVAAITFALPGVAAGNDFSKAWLSAFLERVSALIKYFVAQGIPADVATPEVTQHFEDAFSKIDEVAGQISDFARVDISQLAAMAGVREDAAALWLAQKLGDMSVYTGKSFDATTGKMFVYGGAGASAREKMRQAIEAELRRQAAIKSRAEERRALGADPMFRVTNVLAEGQPVADASPTALVSVASSSMAPQSAPPVAAHPGLSAPAKLGLGAGALGLASLLFFL